MFVRASPGSPRGNADLVELGARPLVDSSLPDPTIEGFAPPPPEAEPAPEGAELDYEQGTLDL